LNISGTTGNPDGFDIALINEIGKRLGVKVEVNDMEFDSLVSSIGSKIDVAIAGMTITDERKQSVDFSDPYYDATQFVLVPTGSSIKTADDLKGKKIGTQLGTTGDSIASEIEGATDSSYDKAVDAVNDMNNGKVDCVIIDKESRPCVCGSVQGTRSRRAGRRGLRLRCGAVTASQCPRETRFLWMQSTQRLLP
jgi:polar amino acid transport system substrate-binding protein